MKKFQTVDYAVEAGVASVTLNRPEKKNAFNDQMVQELGAAIAAASEDNEVRSIVIAAEGNVFSSGLDLEGASNPSPKETLDTVWKPVLLDIAECRKMVITVVNGPAIGFGVAIALAGDMCLMSNEAFFQLPFTGFGWVPDCGLTWQLTRQLGEKRACEYIATGKKLTAAACAESGLVNAAVPAGQLAAEVTSLTQGLMLKAPLALERAKMLVRQSPLVSRSKLMTMEAEVQEFLFATEDAAEAIRAFVEKRSPKFQGK